MSDDNVVKEKNEVSELQKIAEIARKQRKSAPAVSVGRTRIPQKQLIARHAEAFGGQDKERHFFFGDRNKLKEYAYEGIEPVVEAGEIVRCSGDPLMWMPYEQYLESQKESGKRSDMMFKRQVDEAKTASKAAHPDTSIEVHKPAGEPWRRPRKETGG